MLNIVEELIAAGLRSALPPQTDVALGAAPPLEGARDVRVVVLARGLSTQLSQSPEEARDRREPAQPLRRYDLGPHPGTQVSLNLPPAYSGNVVEVQCPPGRLLPADAYSIEGRTLHFFSNRDGSVVALARGDRASGYQETLPCRLELSLTVWAKASVDTTRLFGPAVAAVLMTLHETDVVDLHGQDDGRFMVRLLRPLAEISGLSQGIEEAEGTRRFFASAAIALQADLELTLAAPVAPAPEAVMERVELEQVELERAGRKFPGGGRHPTANGVEVVHR